MSQKTNNNENIIQNNTCICDNDSLEQKKVCFNCKKELYVKMSRHERISECPQHYLTIAICGSTPADLCNECKNDGYELHYEGHGFGCEWKCSKS